MKRKKRLTRRQRKALEPARAAAQHRHIHCIACGKHIDPEAFSMEPRGAVYLTCDHNSRFPACVGCEIEARHRILEHERSGQAVQVAQAWH